MTNENERLKRLQKLLESNKNLEAARLAFEWTKTGVLSKRDFVEFCEMKYTQGLCEHGC